MKNKKANAELGLKTDPLAKMAPDHVGGEYDIHMALAEAKEKYGHLLREIHPRTIYHEALMILKSKRAATQSPIVVEGEHEYQAWLKSKGISELDDDYVSQTGRRPKFRVPTNPGGKRRRHYDRSGNEQIERRATIEHGGDMRKATDEYFRDHPEDWQPYRDEVSDVAAVITDPLCFF